ncbi:hypothetical protein CONPUDRAFT_78409 [Coniophora puteana RWD-64-598 SS2]|uniref:F-box domain-containing protein n=1 Tax=Coniophora puteana (strain RWD-64-598) TaxID=741705 RepID=R7SFT2_CONPW|nr:uncharacterized protein CONPUDRAFT_78409 [Coniophora puteana RWD-64-598 SS2]EIW73949.1 hypothetical protein CONPUDRAFT_78409 [Coniophora puteana RWD-64-598 SS2]
MDRLATEELSSIFLQCPPDDIWVLLQVCRRFYQVAKSTPSLWARIHAKESSRRGSNTGWFTQYEGLKRSHFAPLELTFTLTSIAPYEGSFFQLIQHTMAPKVLSRVRVLHFLFEDTARHVNDTLSNLAHRNAPALEVLKLDLSSYHPRIVNLEIQANNAVLNSLLSGGAPCLREVSLIGFILPSNSVLWCKTLTVLELAKTSVVFRASDLIEILQRTLSLQILRMGEGFHIDEVPVIDISQGWEGLPADLIVHLPNLHLWEFSSTYDQYANLVFLLRVSPQFRLNVQNIDYRDRRPSTHALLFPVVAYPRTSDRNSSRPSCRGVEVPRTFRINVHGSVVNSTFFQQCDHNPQQITDFDVCRSCENRLAELECTFHLLAGFFERDLPPTSLSPIITTSTTAQSITALYLFSDSPSFAASWGAVFSAMGNIRLICLESDPLDLRNILAELASSNEPKQNELSGSCPPLPKLEEMNIRWRCSGYYTAKQGAHITSNAAEDLSKTICRRESIGLRLRILSVHVQAGLKEMEEAFIGVVELLKEAVDNFRWIET